MFNKMKLKNYGLWVSIASLIFMILQDSGVAVTATKYDLYVKTILGVLVLLGIISNPENGSGYKDN